MRPKIDNIIENRSILDKSVKSKSLVLARILLFFAVRIKFTYFLTAPLGSLIHRHIKVLKKERRSYLMAIYHLSIKIISRGKGKSAVVASAYRSGEKIKNEYDGIVHDFTRKGGIAHTEILLPQNAPQEFANRSVLWNSV